MSHPLRVMWLNPIGLDAYDQPMADFIATIKRPETTVDVVSLSLPAVSSHLEYRTYEALIVGDTIRMAREAAIKGYDALAIECFYDPGLEDAREISGRAVITAPCQASIQIAANLCNRFSVIVGRQKWIGQMTDLVRHYGYEHMLASMRSVDIGVPDLQKDPDHTINSILTQGRRAIEEDGAEALILGCTCNFSFYKTVQEELGVPMIDPICAAFKMAEDLAHMKKVFGWAPSRVGSCEPPQEEELAAFGLFAAPPPIGNRVTV